MKHLLRWQTAVLFLLASTPGAVTADEQAGSKATPERIATALGELRKLAERTLDETGVPGMALVVVHDDRVVHLQGLGVREVGKDQPVDADTVFQLASVSKPIAATVVAGLVGDGVVDWDDPIIKHDPGFRMHDPWVTSAVTLRDMFSHRSGLPGHGGDLLEDLGYDREAILYRLRYLKPASSLRSKYAYTNFGLTEAAVAAAHAAGTNWEDLSARRLYEPLGMKSTSSRYADFVANPNRAHGHVRVDGKWIAKHQRHPDAQSPAGGVSASVRDLARWLRLQLANGRIDGKHVIDADALAETHRPQVISRAPKNPAKDRAGLYGLGWNVGYDDKGRVHWSHSGAFDLGAATAVYLLPSEDVGIAVLTNAPPVGAPEALCLSFLDLVREGEVERDWLRFLAKPFAEMAKPAYGSETAYSKPPARRSPPLSFDAYLGVYRNDYFGAVEIVERDAALVLLLGPKKRAFSLRHWDRDTFLYQPVGEWAAGPSGVTFQVGPNQTARNLVIENLDTHHQGTFPRVPSGK